MIKINAIGDTCPIPVVKTINAIKSLKKAEDICVSVDNSVAVENLKRLATSKDFKVEEKQLSEKEYEVIIHSDVVTEIDSDKIIENCNFSSPKKKTVVVIASNKMGCGDEKLGKTLIKGFIFSLSQQDNLPTTIIFYNSGAYISAEDSESFEDLKTLENKGVEILTCGTCADFYGIKEKIKVGTITNMYTIVEKCTSADLIVKP